MTCHNRRGTRLGRGLQLDLLRWAFPSSEVPNGVNTDPTRSNATLPQVSD